MNSEEAEKRGFCVDEGYCVGDMTSALANKHSSTIDPTMIDNADVAERISREVKDFQVHRCNMKTCKRKLMNKIDCIKNNVTPPADWRHITEVEKQRLWKCSKNFPKPLSALGSRMKAHVLVDFNHNVHYEPCRDDGFVNNYHVPIAYCWGANSDMQIIHTGKIYIMFISP